MNFAKPDSPFAAAVDVISLNYQGEGIRFDVEGPGEIVATDHGDPTSFESFQSHDRKVFNGFCLVAVRGRVG